ncbi:MAG TPA: hypothetical protein VLA90_07235 [Actinomycetota bacterium]|nr:hypothetical protein [Actinomycetota bacterium]
MRRFLTCCVIGLVAAGCRDAVIPPSPQAPTRILVSESPSPKFQEVTAGAVQTVIPNGWSPELAAHDDDPRQGLVAGPRPQAWGGRRPPAAGLAAMWVDVTRVGVPSDYYYLAATGPALELITGSPHCTTTHHRVIVDHRPEFAAGERGSPGDYVATGRGRCTRGDQASRWAYFLAAPGYGPVREIGIPSSGLYVVVAMVPESPRAKQLLGRIMDATRFGGASVGDLIAAAQLATTTPLGPI